MLVNIDFNQEKANKIVKRMKKELPDIDYSYYLNLEELYKKAHTGIYFADFNFNTDIELFSNYEIKEDTYSFSPKTLKELVNYENSRQNYGICNNYKEILNEYPELETSNKKFIVSIFEISETKEFHEGEIKWHKYGKYIGNESESERLENRNIFIYNIYEVEEKECVEC